MLSVVMLSVVMLSVVMLSVVMLNVIMLNVLMLNVVAPLYRSKLSVKIGLGLSYKSTAYDKDKLVRLSQWSCLNFESTKNRVWHKR